MTVPWTHLVAVSQLLPQSTLELEPGEAVRAALARHVGVVAIPALSATLELTHTRGGDVLVAGRLTGTLVQTCVVTLEPFTSQLSEEIDVHFAPEAAVAALLDAAGEDEEREDPGDLPDAIVDGTVDLGALAAEFLSLGIDPYPRKPDAVFASPAGEEGTDSPFAALAALKKKEDEPR